MQDHAQNYLINIYIYTPLPVSRVFGARSGSPRIMYITRKEVRVFKGEWPVSYHGTGEYATSTIAQDRYIYSVRERDYLVEESTLLHQLIKMASKYTRFKDKGKRYKIVFHNWVCPDSLVAIDKRTTGVGKY